MKGYHHLTLETQLDGMSVDETETEKTETETEKSQTLGFRNG